MRPNDPEERAWQRSVHTGPARRQAFLDGFRAGRLNEAGTSTRVDERRLSAVEAYECGYDDALKAVERQAQQREDIGQRDPPFVIRHAVGAVRVARFDALKRKGKRRTGEDR